MPMSLFISPVDYLAGGCAFAVVGVALVVFGWRAADLTDESETANAVRESCNPTGIFTVGIALLLASVYAFIQLFR